MGFPIQTLVVNGGDAPVTPMSAQVRLITTDGKEFTGGVTPAEPVEDVAATATAKQVASRLNQLLAHLRDAGLLAESADESEPATD